MGFWWSLFVCNLLIPLGVLLAGRLMWKHYPKKINAVMGYRTKRSMKNMETWKFAHEYCGRLWWKVGFFLIFLTVLVDLPFRYGSEDTVGTVSTLLSIVQIVSLIAAVFQTERALKKTFTAEGIRK